MARTPEKGEWAKENERKKENEKNKKKYTRLNYTTTKKLLGHFFKKSPAQDLIQQGAKCFRT